LKKLFYPSCIMLRCITRHCRKRSELEFCQTCVKHVEEGTYEAYKASLVPDTQNNYTDRMFNQSPAREEYYRGRDPVSGNKINRVHAFIVDLIATEKPQSMAGKKRAPIYAAMLAKANTRFNWSPSKGATAVRTLLIGLLRGKLKALKDHSKKATFLEERAWTLWKSSCQEDGPYGLKAMLKAEIVHEKGIPPPVGPFFDVGGGDKIDFNYMNNGGGGIPKPADKIDFNYMNNGGGGIPKPADKIDFNYMNNGGGGIPKPAEIGELEMDDPGKDDRPPIRRRRREWDYVNQDFLALGGPPKKKKKKGQARQAAEFDNHLAAIAPAKKPSNSATKKANRAKGKALQEKRKQGQKNLRVTLQNTLTSIGHALSQETTKPEAPSPPPVTDRQVELIQLVYNAGLERPTRKLVLKLIRNPATMPGVDAAVKAMAESAVPLKEIFEDLV